MIVPGDVNSTLAGGARLRPPADPAGPRRGGPALVRPDDARGGQPRARRPGLRPALHPLAGGAGQPGARGHRAGAGPARRQHDDRLARRARGPLPRAPRLRASTGSSPAPTCSSRCTGRRSSTAQLLRDGDRAARRGRGRDAGALPGPPADARARSATRPSSLPDGLRLIEPVGYLDFLSLEADARAVLTDSGGIQEETTYLGVRCFTLRDNTERPITIERRHQPAARARSGPDRRDPGADRAAAARCRRSRRRSGTVTPPSGSPPKLRSFSRA